MSYTKGQWKLTEDYSVLAFDGEQMILIAEVSREAGHAYKANAHLISAAPDLLTAATMVLETLECRGDEDCDHCVLFQAVAKAEGRES